MEQETMVCKVCGHTVPIAKKFGRRGNLCSACRQRYRQLKIKVRAVEYLGSKCEKCGYNKNIEALDFHHRNPEEKSFEISKAYNRSWEYIKPELDKCALLCANCHREITCLERKMVTIEEYEKWIKPKHENLSKEQKDLALIEQEKQQKIEENLQKIENRKRIIQNSNIDFTKYGWAKKLEPILHIASASIVRWIKKHMPKFYNEKCYKETLVDEAEVLNIIERYKSNESITSISKKMHIDNAKISTILKQHGFNIVPCGKKEIYMINKNTGNVIETFDSIRNAARYCLQNINNQTSLQCVTDKISLCANGHRKTAYGYKWKFVNQ